MPHDVLCVAHGVDNHVLGLLGLAARAQVVRQKHRQPREVQHEVGPHLPREHAQAGHLHHGGVLVGQARLHARKVDVLVLARRGQGAAQAAAQRAQRGLLHHHGRGGAHGGAQATVHAEALGDDDLLAAGRLRGGGLAQGVAGADVHASLARALLAGRGQAQRGVKADGPHKGGRLLARHAELRLLCHGSPQSSPRALLCPDYHAGRAIGATPHCVHVPARFQGNCERPVAPRPPAAAHRPPGSCRPGDKAPRGASAVYLSAARPPGPARRP